MYISLVELTMAFSLCCVCYYYRFEDGTGDREGPHRVRHEELQMARQQQRPVTSQSGNGAAMLDLQDVDVCEIVATERRSAALSAPAPVPEATAVVAAAVAGQPPPPSVAYGTGNGDGDCSSVGGGGGGGGGSGPDFNDRDEGRRSISDWADEIPLPWQTVATLESPPSFSSDPWDELVADEADSSSAASPQSQPPLSPQLPPPLSPDSTTPATSSGGSEAIYSGGSMSASSSFALVIGCNGEGVDGGSDDSGSTSTSASTGTDIGVAITSTGTSGSAASGSTASSDDGVLVGAVTTIASTAAIEWDSESLRSPPRSPSAAAPSSGDAVDTPSSAASKGSVLSASAPPPTPSTPPAYG